MPESATIPVTLSPHRRRAPRACGAVAGVCLALAAAASAEAQPWPAPPAPCGASFASCVFGELEPISLETFEALERRDPEILHGTSRGAVLRTSADRARFVLDAMIEAGWGSMQFFAHPLFARDKRVLFFGPDILELLDREYVIPATFPIRGELREAVGDHPKGSAFAMEGFLIGNGRVVALYPHAIKVHRVDPPFDLFTGNYSFFAVNVVDNRSTEDHLRLDHYRGRNRPTDSFGEVRAPLGCDLKGLDLEGTDPVVRVDIRCFPWAPDWEIRNPRLERR